MFELHWILFYKVCVNAGLFPLCGLRVTMKVLSMSRRCGSVSGVFVGKSLSERFPITWSFSSWVSLLVNDLFPQSPYFYRFTIKQRNDQAIIPLFNCFILLFNCFILLFTSMTLLKSRSLESLMFDVIVLTFTFTSWICAQNIKQFLKSN